MTSSPLPTSWRLMTLVLCWLVQVPLVASRFTTASLYVSNGTHLLHLTPDGQVEPVVSQGIHRAVGVAVDAWLGYVFWTDIGAGHQGVYRAHLDGSRPQRIVKDVGRVNGLATDWVSRHVYWTDEERQTIEMTDYNGDQRKIVLNKDMKWPRGIVLDPLDGLMYWGDQGTQQIERARLDGSRREVLVSTGLIWPNQLAISYTTRRLYWVDAYNKTIESCELLGDGRRKEHDLLESPYSAPIFGLAVADRTAFISTWYDGAVYSVRLGRHDTPEGDDEQLEDRLRPEAEQLTQREMFSVAVSDRTAQPRGTNVCGQAARGGCSHICLMTSTLTYRCACPTYGSLVLGADEKTCVEPTEMLLYADKDKGQVGILPLGGSNVSDLYILASSVMPVAVGYDPVDQGVYWSDVKERVIYRVSLNGSDRQAFLGEEDGIGTVDGLQVEWRSRRLYFCNMGNSSPKSDGAVFTWHRVEFVSLDRRQRRVVVSDVGKPRAIVVDADHGYLYYSDWGDNPRVVRTDLNGDNPTEIRGSGTVSNPNGLALHGRWLYLVDSNYNNRVRVPYMAAYDTLTETWADLDSQQVLIPFGLAAKEGQVFYTDWVSTESTTGAIFAYDVNTHVTTAMANHMSNPTGLHYSLARKTLPDGSTCDNSDCGDICVRQSSSPRSTCLCSEGKGRTLAKDGKKCEEPSSFLLFSDLNTIKLVSLNVTSGGDVTSDNHVYTLYYGYCSANYVAVSFDPETKQIYWSDLYRKQILTGDITGRAATVFHSGEHAIDGLALDTVGRHLYWTGYTDYSGVIAMAGLSPGGASYSELLTGLDQPRAIVLHVDRRYLYWTEYGRRSGRPRVGRAYLDGSHNETIADTRLTWPNALAIAGDKLYLADGSHLRIDVFDLDGSNRREVPLGAANMDHIFGMVVVGRHLYYTDWLTNRTTLVDLDTGSTTTLADHLYRPGALVLHGPADTRHPAGSTVCLSGRHDCREICVPVPEGYHCACPLGKKLAEDKRSCIDATTWAATDWFRCPEECHSNAHCARLLPTSIFRCVCREGFHGDGVRDCQACPVDTYKVTLGNSSCTPCPPAAGTIGWTGSATCTCDDPNYDFVTGHCVLHVIAENETSNDSPSGYAVSPPVFVGCPQGELLQFTLEENTSSVTLDVPISARSWRGQEVAVSGSHRLPPGLSFSWRGAGLAGHQPVTYIATDPWGQRATCNFTVQVVDGQPPVFHHCPSSTVLRGAPGGGQRVFWEEPEVVDNVEVTETRGPVRPSGNLFEAGTWNLSYTAKDGQGNVAWCNFTVTVTQIELACPSSPSLQQPLHGGIQCGPDEDTQAGFRCLTFCDPVSYDLNPDPAYHGLRCDHQGRWLDAFPADYVTKACLRKTALRLVLRKLHFWLYGPCDPDSGALKAEIVSAILRLMEADGLCSWTYGARSVYNTCRDEEVDVTCNRGHEGRERRSNGEGEGQEGGENGHEVGESGHEGGESKGNPGETDDKDAGDVLVMWTVMETASSEANVSEAEEKVTSRASRLQARFDLGLTFMARGATYRSIEDRAIVAPLVLECGLGAFNTSNMCLLCPVGTFHSKETSWCVDCPPGGYQDIEGQETCKQCPEGTYSLTGAFNLSQCFVVAGPPAVFQVSHNTVIVAVGSVVLALFTLLLVFLCCRHYRRHRHFRGKMCGDAGRAGQENPYVIEIRTDRQGRVTYQEVPSDLAEKQQPVPSTSSKSSTPSSKTQSCHEQLLQERPTACIPVAADCHETGNLSLKPSQQKRGIARHNRAPAGGSAEKCQPLISDNREEICLEVQSVLQAGGGGGCARTSDDACSAARGTDLEDTPVHSSTALLHHSTDTPSDVD